MASARPTGRIVAPVLLAALLLVPGIEAATPIPRTLEQLSVDADLVVVGTVRSHEARFNDRRTLILTHTTVDVVETVVGEPTAVIEISEYGGRVGDLGLKVPGLPRYADGEKILLFLCRDALDLLRTCGATQGRLRVETTSEGATRASGTMAGKPVVGKLDELRARILAAREEADR
jgi:hypothetical protein